MLFKPMGAHALLRSQAGLFALSMALMQLADTGKIPANPVRHFVAAVSVGISNHVPVLDLDYVEDCAAHTDMNIVMTDAQSFIEVQGTAEQQAFTREELATLLDLASHGIQEIIQYQKSCLGCR